MIAFIIPIHPKHYEFMYKFLDTFDKLLIKNIDIYLVFSNQSDYNNFNKKNKIKEIFIPQNVNTGNIVTYKKFFALDSLKDNTNFEYFIVCDAEIELIPENFNEINILNKISKIYENKIIYAGKVNDNTAIMITENSISLLNNSKKLKKITKNSTLYFWWSDLPVYKREHLPHFFSLIKYSNITWFHFDHLIYLGYLILYHEFTLLNVTPIINHNWSLESYNTTNVENLIKLKLNKYGFSYVTKPLYNNNKEFLINEGTFLLYHLDR